VLILALNDHLLKGSGLLPCTVTGKLSDIAGLFFFPVLLMVVLSRVLPSRWLAMLGERGLSLGAIAATGEVFSLIKLSPTFNALAAHLGFVNALDATDLFALPALGATWLFLRFVRPPSCREGLRSAAVVASGLACMATQVTQYTRVYPHWRFDEPARRTLACAEVETWVARSGKEGAGVTVEVRAPDVSCEVSIERAELWLRERSIAARSLPGTLQLHSGETLHAWLVFPFDGDAAWNAGEHKARLRLGLRTGDATQEWDLGLTSAIEGGSQIKGEPRPERAP
jgi:hypothetical protein